MDELDILKKDWNKEPTDNKKLSVKDLYAMLYKKSSSIVKILFYISIAELVFWIFINNIPYFSSDSYQEKLDAMFPNDYVFTVITILSYIVILIFIYFLYKAYKNISVTDNAKKLMKSILKTRKIIKYYVLYNLVMMGISLIFGFYFALHHDPKTIESIAALGENGTLIFTSIIIVFSIVFLTIFWLFYKLLYGILLKRLNRNYKELKQLEV